MTAFRPNLAAKLKKGQTYEEMLTKLSIEEGFICTPKLDGIRITVHPKLGAVTRTLKPIPNRTLREHFAKNHLRYSGFDGELVWGDHTSPDYSFQKTFSKFSTEEDEDQSLMQFHVFDMINNPAHIYRDRLEMAQKCIAYMHTSNFLVWVPYKYAFNLKTVFQQEQKYLERGYEGLMLRHCCSLFKQGRSTFREQGLIALKRFVDEEAIITGFEELMHNENEPTINALGYTERSSALAGKVPAGTLGKLLCVGASHATMWKDVNFKVGSGFSAAQRQDIWDNRESYLGRQFTYKYQEAGSKNKPRAPIFKSFRNDI